MTVHSSPHHQSDYALLQSSLQRSLSLTSVTDFPKIIILHGSSDYLVNETVQKIQTKFAEFDGTQSVSLDYDDLANGSSPEGFTIQLRTLLSQRSLFDPQVIYTLRRFPKASAMATLFKHFKSPSSVKSWIMIELLDKPTAELKKLLAVHHAIILNCEGPKDSRDLLSAITDIAHRLELHLADDAKNLLMSACGFNLSALHNELTKIALVFHGQNAVITAAMIAPMIGFIREDHVFELFSYLRSNQTSRAELLLHQLLERHEKAIALAGILSRFHRDQIVRGRESSNRSLLDLAKLDQDLKSSRSDESLLLSTIIQPL